MTNLQRAICYVIGAIALLLGIVNEDTRWGLIVLGLLLLGVLSVDQIAAIVRAGSRRDDEPPSH